MHPVAFALAAAVAVALVARRRSLTRVTGAVGLVVVAAFVVYGAGVLQPPDLQAVLLKVGRTLGPWTYVLVAALAFLETGAFVGFVAPGETAVITGGVIAGQGEVDVVALLLLTWAASVAGDTLSFWLGRRLGRAFLLRHGPRFGVTEHRIEQVEGFFARHGGPAVFIGRFVGFIRPLAPFVAGASRMAFGRFLPYDVAGAGLWSAAFVLLGYVSWRNIDRATRVAGSASLAVGAVVVLAVAIVVLVRRRRAASAGAR